MAYRDLDKHRKWQRENRENTHEKREHRRAYERERKNRKRIEQYMLLPEPERTRKLEANAYRRSLNLRWKARTFVK